MSSIFENSIGGARMASSPTTQANLIKGQENVKAEQDREFARTLKAVQQKAEIMNKTAETSSAEDKKLREVCQEMEAVFLNMLLSTMRNTVPERELFPKGNGEKIMESMLDMELTRTMAKANGVGIGELLYKQLSNPGVTHIPTETN